MKGEFDGEGVFAATGSSTRRRLHGVPDRGHAALRQCSPGRCAGSLRQHRRQRHRCPGRDRARRDAHGHQHRHRARGGSRHRCRRRLHLPQPAARHLRRQGGALRLPRAQGDRHHGDGRQPGAHQHRAGGRLPHRDGAGRRRHDLAADGQGRSLDAAQLEGDHRPAAEPVPELPGAPQPGARHDAGAVPERRDRLARPVAPHLGQRHAAEQQRDAHRRRRLGQHLAAAPRRLRPAGRDDRDGQRLDQQLRRRVRDGRRRGDDRDHEVGHQRGARVRVLVRQHRRDERQHVLQQRVRPAEGSAQPQHLRRHRRRAGDAQQAVLLRVVRALRRSARVARQLRRAHGADAHRRLRRSRGRLRQLPPLQPVHRRRRRRRPRAVPEQHHPGVDDQRGGALGDGLLPAAQHDGGSQFEPDPRRLPAVPRGPGRSQQLRPQDDLAAQRVALGVGQVLDAGRGSDRQLLARLRRRQPRRHPRLRRRPGPHLDAEPDPRVRRQLRRQHPEPAGHRAGLRRRPRASTSASPARTAPTSPRAACRTSRSGPTTTPATTSAPRRTGCRCSARSAATRSAPG